MKDYRVTYNVTGTADTIVEAENETEAREKAREYEGGRHPRIGMFYSGVITTIATVTEGNDVDEGSR